MMAVVLKLIEEKSKAEFSFCSRKSARLAELIHGNTRGRREDGPLIKSFSLMRSSYGMAKKRTRDHRMFSDVRRGAGREVEERKCQGRVVLKPEQTCECQTKGGQHKKKTKQEV